MPDNRARSGPPLTPERLRELLHYDPETGMFTWRVQRRGRGRVNQPAGGVRERGYVTISVDMVRYRAHRLAWLYVHGVWPENGLDHINGVTNDNRISNLRDIPPALNAQNRSATSNAKSGFSGVEIRANTNGTKYRAFLRVNGRKVVVGTFDTASAASSAAQKAKATSHPGWSPR